MDYWNFLYNYVRLDVGAVSKQFNAASPFEQMWTVGCLFAFWSLLLFVLFSVISVRRSEAGTKQARSILGVATVLTGGLGIILFVLDTRSKSIDDDYSRFDVEYNSRIQQIPFLAEAESSICKASSIASVSRSVPELASERVFCLMQDQLKRSARFLTSFEPVQWAGTHVEFRQLEEPKYNDLIQLYRSEFEAASAALLKVHGEYQAVIDELQLGETKNGVDIAGIPASLIDVKKFGSDILQRYSETRYNDGTVQYISGLTIVFLSIMIVGMSMQLLLALPPATFLSIYHLKNWTLSMSQSLLRSSRRDETVPSDEDNKTLVADDRIDK